MQDAAESLSAISRALRDLGLTKLSSVADSIGGLLNTLPNLREASITGSGVTAAQLSTAAAGISVGAAIGSAIVPVLSGLFGGQSEAEKRLAEELHRNTVALEKYRDEFIKQRSCITRINACAKRTCQECADFTSIRWND